MKFMVGAVGHYFLHCSLWPCTNHKFPRYRLGGGGGGGGRGNQQSATASPGEYDHGEGAGRYL